MKKKIIFVYPAMNIGGSTTSLLSILNRLNYNKYDVDLLLDLHSGELMDMIPSTVKLLPPAFKYLNKRQEYIHRFLSPNYMFSFFVSRIIAIKTGVEIQAAQYMSYKDVEFYRNIDKDYDVAVSFLEGRWCKYIANHIKARKKISWIHNNYVDLKLNPRYDTPSLSAMDSIVFVSDECKKAFDDFFPDYVNKTTVVENIISNEFVQRRAKSICDLTVNDSAINLITVCRVTFESKGLDRALTALKRIKEDGLLQRIVWYVVGDGKDMSTLCEVIHKNKLEDNIKLLGAKTNPYPYLKNMSMFFLPSRREGKPMVVTEAFMMGLPALVTEYSSAREQVRDGIDGIIVENSEDGIYEGLKRIIEHPEIIPELKKNVINTDYSNVEEIKKVEQLLDE